MSARNRRLEPETARQLASGSQEAREIEIVVSMLRSLPEPEPSSDLTARVMQRVLEIEARPKLLRPAFGRFSDSGAAAVLAAGIACAAVGIGLQLMQAPSSAPVAVATSAPAGDVPLAGSPRRTVASLVSTPAEYPSRLAESHTASLFSRTTSEAVLPGFPVAQPTANIFDRRLDAQLNELQLDPHAFFHRLERVQQRERFVQRLAERAVRRGDAAQVALNVRTVQHPLVRPMVEQLLQASLIRRVSE